MLNKLLAKSKPFFIIHLIFVLGLLAASIITNTNLSDLYKIIGIIIGINIFIIVVIQMLMYFFFTFSRILLIEIYSTLLCLLSGLLIITVLFLKTESVELKLLLLSIFESLFISSLFSRMLYNKMNIEEYSKYLKEIKEDKDNKKIIN